MSGRELNQNTKCRSLGFINNPPRGYFRTVKTCASNLREPVNDIVQTNIIVPKTGDCVTIGEESPASTIALPGLEEDVGETLTQFLVRDPADSDKIKWRTAPSGMIMDGSPPVALNGILGCATVDATYDPLAFDTYEGGISSDSVNFQFATIATTENLTSFTNLSLLIDDCTVEAGFIILVKDQTDPIENGVYEAVDDSPFGTVSLIRMDFGVGSPVVVYPKVVILRGTTNGTRAWILDTSPLPVIGVDPLTFTETDTLTDDEFGTSISVSTCGIITNVTLPNILYLTMLGWIIYPLKGQSIGSTVPATVIILETGAIRGWIPPTVLGNVATVETSIPIDNTNYCIQLIPGVVRLNPEGLFKTYVVAANNSSPNVFLTTSPSILGELTEYYETLVIPTHPILDRESVNGTTTFNISPHADPGEVARWIAGGFLASEDETGVYSSGVVAAAMPCAMQIVISQCTP